MTVVVAVVDAVFVAIVTPLASKFERGKPSHGPRAATVESQALGCLRGTELRRPPRAAMILMRLTRSRACWSTQMAISATEVPAYEGANRLGGPGEETRSSRSHLFSRRSPQLCQTSSRASHRQRPLPRLGTAQPASAGPANTSAITSAQVGDVP